MIIAMYLFIINIVVPQLIAFANALYEPMITIVIMLAGIVMIFGAVGMTISANLGSTIMGGLFRAIGFIVVLLVTATSWILVHAFGLVPNVFTGSRRTFTQMGMNQILATVLASLLALLIIVIII